MVDLYLKSAIEGVVIKWASQINDVLNDDSSLAFANGQNPTPWAGRSIPNFKESCKTFLS